MSKLLRNNTGELIKNSWIISRSRNNIDKILKTLRLFRGLKVI